MKPDLSFPRSLAASVLLAALTPCALLAQTTERASLDPGGAQVPFTSANGLRAIDLSDDGDLACFVATPSGGTATLYARDLGAGQTRVIQAGINGVVVLGLSLAGDGNSVAAAFGVSPPLFPGDDNGTNDIYSFLTANGAPIWVSVTAAGDAPNVASWDPDVSEDGLEVAWSSNTAGPNSAPSNMTADTVAVGSGRQVYFRQLPGGTTKLISVTPGGAGGNGASHFPQISDSGRYIAFQSDASDLVPGDTNGTTDVFVWDELLETLTLVSRNGSGVQAAGRSVEPSISANGRFVLYRSDAGNLGPGAQAGFDSLWVLDRDDDVNGNLTNTNGVTTLASVSSGGVPVYDGFGGAWPAQISDDGNEVLFHRVGFGLEPNPNGFFQVWLHDRSSGQTTNVHVDSAGHAANHSAELQIALAGDGSRALYRTNASNLDLVLADTNGQADVYAHAVCVNPGKDLGFSLAGTGGLRPELSVCGALETASTAEVRLRRARPNATSVAIYSLVSAPRPFFGGTLVPGAPIGTLLFTTDANGEVTFPASISGGPATLFVQWAVIDPAAVQRVALSNALELAVGP